MKKEFMDLWKNLGEMSKLHAKVKENVYNLEKLGLTNEELRKLHNMFLNLNNMNFRYFQESVIEMYKERNKK